MSQEKRKVYLDEVYEDARDDLNNFSYHSSDEESSYPSSSLSLSLSLDSDSGSKNVPIKKNKTSHNIIFDMLSDYHGYARRIGNESDCFIEYEYKNNILSINQFICTKGGKQLLDDLLKALNEKGLNVHTVELIAAGLDKDKRDQGKNDTDLFKTYIDMGFTRVGLNEFIATREDILKTHQDRLDGIEPNHKKDEYEDYEDLLKEFPEKGGSRKTKRRRQKKTKQKTKRRRNKKTKRKTKRRRQTKKRGKR